MRGFKKRFILLQIYEILQPYPAIRSFACSQQTIKPGPLTQQGASASSCPSCSPPSLLTTGGGKTDCESVFTV